MITRSNTAQFLADSAKLSVQQLATYEYSAMRKLWELCGDVFDGEQAVKSRGEYIYIPAMKQGVSVEAQKARAAYISRGKLPNEPAQMLHQMLGVLCKAMPDVTLSGKAAQLEFMKQFATPYHDGLDGLFRRSIEQVLRTGRYCLLLEPDNADGRGFHINEFRAHKFLRAKVARRGEETYAKVVILDTSSIDYDTRIWKDVFCPQITLLAVTEPTSTMPSVYYQAKFGQDSVPLNGFSPEGEIIPAEYDFYAQAMSRVFSALEKFDVENPDPSVATSFVVPDKYGRTFDRIPFTCCNASNLNFMRFDKPPLLNPCVEALHLLQADCDYQQAVYLTTDPIPTFTNVDKKSRINLSADRAMYLPDGARFEYVTAPASGLQQQAENIKSMFADLQRMGVSLAGTEGSVKSSGVALEITRNAQTADLRTINATVGSAVEEQLRFAGKWLGMNADEIASDIKFTVHQDFADPRPSAADVTTIANNADALNLTDEEIRNYVVRAGIADARPWKELKEILEKEREAKNGENIDSVARAFGFNSDGENGEN